MEVHSRAEAIRLGLKFYFTGKSCKHGHIAERRMVGGCVDCRRVAHAAVKRKRYWRADKVAARSAAAEILKSARKAAREKREMDRELRLEARVAAQASSAELRAARRRDESRRYFVENRDKILARSKLRRVADPIRYSQTARQWYLANKEKRREQSKRWRSENRAKVNAGRSRRKIWKRAVVVGDLTKLQRGRCAYCRILLTAANRHVDHIQPRKRGGGNARRNLQLACDVCNVRKSAKDPIVFAQELGRLLS